MHPFTRSKKKEHPFSCSTLPFEKICVCSAVQKEFTSIQLFDLTIRKNYICSAVQLNRLKKNLHLFNRSTDPFRTACLAVSYPFACRVFSLSNGYRKERFHVRGHIFLMGSGRGQAVLSLSLWGGWEHTLVLQTSQIILTYCC